MIKVKQYIITPVFKLWYEATLPGKRVVCHQCNGEGTMVNPNIGVLTAHDMEDEDFRESYMSGVYDVACGCCDGKRVIDVLDYDALSPKMQLAVDKAEKEIAADEAEAYYEQKWGA
jgi:hypothetical protein